MQEVINKHSFSLTSGYCLPFMYRIRSRNTVSGSLEKLKNVYEKDENYSVKPNKQCRASFDEYLMSISWWEKYENCTAFRWMNSHSPNQINWILILIYMVEKYQYIYIYTCMYVKLCLIRPTATNWECLRSWKAAIYEQIQSFCLIHCKSACCHDMCTLFVSWKQSKNHIFNWHINKYHQL